MESIHIADLALQHAGAATGLGQTVAVVELSVIEKQGYCDNHAQAVVDTFLWNANGHLGMYLMGLNFEDRKGDGRGVRALPGKIATLAALDKYVDGVGCNVLNAVSNKIERLMKWYPHVRVMNLSFGKTRAEIYQDVFLLLNKTPRLQKAFQKKYRVPDDGLNEISFRKTIADYVNERLDVKKKLHAKALQRYQTVTRNAAQAGLVVVVAADNDNALAQYFMAPQSGLNFLAQSGYVISVAAVSKTGKVWAGSSRGNGFYNPTLAALGVEVQTSREKWTGTSFATPQVSTTVAKMLLAKPSLTFPAVRSILQMTAIPLEAGFTEAGAGMLNPKAALLQASGRMTLNGPSVARSA